MPESVSIAIVGAGIAGLTAALSLASRGFSVDIIEQAAELSSIGAGLQLSPNATGILARLGLLPALEAVWTEPNVIALVDGRTLKPLAQVPSGAFARNRWKAPYGVLHRASLQRILIEAVARQPLCRLHLGQKLETADPQSIAALTGQAAGLIIGADGVWSSVRTQVAEAGRALFSGHVAFRLTVGWDAAPSLLDPGRVIAFLGRKAHLVAYPLRDAKLFNLVAITKGLSGQSLSWDGSAAGARQSELLAALSGWHPDLRRLIGLSPEPTFWPLHEVSDGPWHNGRDTILIGDAAHAMMPFAAQGAAMAIEDAWELAAFLDSGRSQPQALAAFVEHRKKRIGKVRARGAFNRFAYHASGPVGLARNLVLSRKRPEDLAADLDWLYGYSAGD
ncbi:FAD-dependent oxidoreductase [Pararhizobium antarcticum]|uniref:Salicylate hydroxylase n=1 Tax=Pararhizobium antarcticum TaxID=1798805 RepID=A0A657LL52_9HYPH|nr:FAD-dependent oxidoreductase [Pararhizobium antarcticum]OJF89995.1 salicylate hydroxylase [Pararhizobium antarcticum]